MAPRLWDLTDILPEAFHGAGNSLWECAERPFCKIEDLSAHLAQAADHLERCLLFYSDLVPTDLKLASHLLVELEDELGLCRPEVQQDLPQGYGPSCRVIVVLCRMMSEQIIQAVVGPKTLEDLRRSGQKAGKYAYPNADDLIQHLLKAKQHLEALWRYCDVVRFVGNQFVHALSAEDCSLKAKLQSREVQPTACIIAVYYLIAIVRWMGDLVMEHEGYNPAEVTAAVEKKAKKRALQRKEDAARRVNRSKFRVAIGQPDLQQLWLDHLSQWEEVAWDDWWRVFPAKLTGQLPDQQRWLLEWFSSGDQRRRAAFKAALGLENADKLSAAALGNVFSDTSASLVDAIRHMTSCLLPKLNAQYCAEARQQEADRACELLTQQQRTAVVLVGKGGLGKTQLSLDIGWRLFNNKQLPGGAAMVRLRGASTPARVVAEFHSALGLELDPSPALAPETVTQKPPNCSSLLSRPSFDPDQTGAPLYQEGMDRVIKHLASLPPKETQLLVLDNAQDSLHIPELRQLVAQITERAPAIRLLVTSRERWPEGCSDVQHVDVASMANNHLKTIALQSNVQLAEDEMEDMLGVSGGSPLKLRLLADALKDDRLSMECIQSATMKAKGVLHVVLQSLRASHQLALARLSVFPYAFSAQDAAAVLKRRYDQGQAADLLNHFHEHGLLEFDSAIGRHTLHQDVRHAAANQPREEMPGVIEAAQEAFARLLVGRMQSYANPQLTARERQVAVLRAVQRDMRNWQELEQLQQGRPELLDANMSKQEAMNLKKTAQLVSNCGRHFAVQPILRVVMAWSQRVLGEEHPSTLTTLNNLAACLNRQGKHAEAEAMYRQALAARQRVLGKEHPDTLTTLTNLASCLDSQGKHVEAEAMYRQALAACQRVLGKEHPDTLTTLTNLAACLNRQGKHAEAEAMYRQALAARQRVLGKEHPNTLATLTNLASCLDSQGKHVEAEAMYRQALAACQRVLGKEHPDTLTTLTNLAGCLDSQGKHVEAEAMYRQALAACQRVLGKEHPDTLTTLTNLAGCLDSQGKHVEAEAMYRQALAACQRVLGKEHPDTLTTLTNLAGCLDRKGKHAEAEAMTRQALAACKRVLGEEHPATLTTLTNLAACLDSQGKHVEAEAMYPQALAACKRVLGEEHPNTLATLTNLAICLENLKKFNKAEAMFRTSLEQHVKVLGPTHSDTMMLYDRLKLWLEVSGRNPCKDPTLREVIRLRVVQARTASSQHQVRIEGLERVVACHCGEHTIAL